MHLEKFRKFSQRVINKQVFTEHESLIPNWVRRFVKEKHAVLSIPRNPVPTLQELGVLGKQDSHEVNQDGERDRMEASELQYFLTLVALGAPGRKEEVSQQCQGSRWTRENRKAHTGSSHRPPWNQVPWGLCFSFVSLHILCLLLSSSASKHAWTCSC